MNSDKYTSRKQILQKFFRIAYLIEIGFIFSLVLVSVRIRTDISDIRHDTTAADLLFLKLENLIESIAGFAIPLII
ncbi:unnamed protein product [Rhizophagus irregularis]|nr:unnamed protein product [Rhizophagus irregularis]